MGVSIITAVYNGVQTISDCIESIQNQSCPVEHIIIDGGSTDGTIDIIEEYKSDIARVVSEPDNGIYDAMNKGIQLVSGDIVGILNADDFYADSTVLEKVADAFADKSIGSCYGDLQYVGKNDTKKVIRYWKSSKYKHGKFKYGWMPPHPTFFVRRSIYEKFGFFNLELGSAADYELMLRFLLKHKITTTYIPKVLVKMRAGGMSNASLKNRLKANRMDRLAWKVNSLKPLPWTLWMKPFRKIHQYFRRP